MHRSASFNKCIESYNHHHNQDKEQLLHCQNIPSCCLFVVKASPIPNPWEHLPVFISIVLPFPESHISEIIQFAPSESGFFHLAESICDSSMSINSLFLFIAKQYFIVPEFVGLFTNEEHSGCFQFLVIINNAALNVIHCKCRFLCECKFSFFYGK